MMGLGGSIFDELKKELNTDLAYENAKHIKTLVNRISDLLEEINLETCNEIKFGFVCGMSVNGKVSSAKIYGIEDGVENCLKVLSEKITELK